VARFLPKIKVGFAIETSGIGAGYIVPCAMFQCAIRVGFSSCMLVSFC